MPEKRQTKPITPTEVVVIGNTDLLADALAQVWAEAVVENEKRSTNAVPAS